MPGGRDKNGPPTLHLVLEWQRKVLEAQYPLITGPGPSHERELFHASVCFDGLCLSTSFNFMFFPWCIFMNGHGKLAVAGPKSNFQLYCAIILLCIPPSHCLRRSLGPRWYHEWQHNKCMVTWCVSKACLQAADCGSCWGREGAQSVLLSCKTTEEPFKKEWFPKIHSQHFHSGRDLGIWQPAPYLTDTCSCQGWWWFCINHLNQPPWLVSTCCLHRCWGSMNVTNVESSNLSEAVSSWWLFLSHQQLLQMFAIIRCQWSIDILMTIICTKKCVPAWHQVTVCSIYFLWILLSVDIFLDCNVFDHALRRERTRKRLRSNQVTKQWSQACCQRIMDSKHYWKHTRKQTRLISSLAKLGGSFGGWLGLPKGADAIHSCSLESGKIFSPMVELLYGHSSFVKCRGERDANL